MFVGMVESLSRSKKKSAEVGSREGAGGEGKEKGK